MNNTLFKIDSFKRKYIVLLSMNMFLILSACEPTQKIDQNDQTHHQDQDVKKAVVKINTKEKCNTAEQLLNEIYQKQLHIVDLNLVQLKHYFSDPMAELIQKDNQCSIDNEGVCAIEFDVFTDSQDPQFQSYTINQSQALNQYEVVLDNHGEQTKIKFEMSQGSCPKIENIYYEESDLKQVLKE